MGQPSISVVVATNRDLPFLTDALASVEAQTHLAWEGVVVDDGSPGDDGAAVAALVARHPRFRLMRIPASGVAAARNAGAAATTGELIAFLDDDDTWPEDWLARHAAAHAAHPDAVATYAGTRSIEADGREMLRDPGLQVDRPGLARRDVSLFTGTMVWKRKGFTAAGGFDESLRLAEDLDLVLRAAELGPLIHVPEVLLGHRTHGRNTTADLAGLADAIDLVLARHIAAAHRGGDAAVVAALASSLDANARFRVWGAGQLARRRLRDRRPLAALRALAAAAPSLPRALISRVRRPRR